MRQVLPELLDSLPHDDPAASRSRGELHLINGIMGNHRWLCRELQQRGSRNHRVLELGAGDGTLARRAWSEGIIPSSRWSALDLAPSPARWPGDAAWHQRDVLAQPELPTAEIVVANLFLHHFQDGQLAMLGKRLPEACRTLLACEPARRRVPALLGRVFCTLAQLSPVTRHDMMASIRAGFIGDDLPRAMGLRGWQTKVTLTPLGAYRLTATR